MITLFCFLTMLPLQPFETSFNVFFLTTSYWYKKTLPYLYPIPRSLCWNWRSLIWFLQDAAHEIFRLDVFLSYKWLASFWLKSSKFHKFSVFIKFMKSQLFWLLLNSLTVKLRRTYNGINNQLKSDKNASFWFNLTSPYLP